MHCFVIFIFDFFRPLLHKLNWDFLKPRVSCAAQVTGSLLAQFGFEYNAYVSQAVLFLSPFMAVTGEFILPVAFWRLEPTSWYYRFAWMGGVLFHVYT